jgi:hypothetical protein
MSEIALYIDIEGFASKFENGARQSFVELTNDLFKLGQNYFNNFSFYQFGGDGFLIKEIFSKSNDLEKFIDIAASLLQAILIRGGIGRAQISYGNMVDITDAYSEEIKSLICQNKNNILSDYKNIMSVNPIIGNAIINCHKLKGPSGPLLLIDKKLIQGKDLSDFIQYKNAEYTVYGVNWINRKNERIIEILNILELDITRNISHFKKYLSKNKISNLNWIKEANLLIYQIK